MIKTVEDLRVELNKQSGVMFLGQMPSDIYRSHEALSQSELKLIAEHSPAHYRYNRRYPRPDTDPKKLGRAAHVAILEPMRFHELYIKAPDVNRRTKAGKAEWDNAEAYARQLGMEMLLADHYDAALEMRDAVRKSEVISEIFQDGVAERMCFGYVHDVHAKAQLDYYRPKAHQIIDLKSTKCASKRQFERDIRSYRYHWQAVWYMDLVEAITGHAPTFTIVAVETSPPYCSAIYTIKQDLATIARHEMMGAVRLYQECQRTGVWPGYPMAVNEVSAHSWEWEAYLKSLKYA
jgi:exodeoxyribonuclease VIII